MLQWFDNGLIEGIYSLVQAAKAKARGYRSTRNPKTVIYLLVGQLDVRLPAF
jgi:transposase